MTTIVTATTPLQPMESPSAKLPSTDPSLSTIDASTVRNHSQSYVRERAVTATSENIDETDIKSDGNGAFIDLSDFEDTGDVVIRAGLGLFRDGRIILQNADHDILLELESRSVVIHGDLTVKGTFTQSADILSTTTDTTAKALASHKRQDTDESHPIERYPQLDSAHAQNHRPISVRRIDVSRFGGSIEVKLTPGIGILECIAIDNIDVSEGGVVDIIDDDNVDSQTMNAVASIDVEWDSSLLGSPFVMSQFIGPSFMEFKILNITEDGMQCELVSLDPSEPLQNCKVHYHIQETT